MNYFKSYIYLIVIIKLAFIAMAIEHIYLIETNKENSELDKKIVYWKERFEFIFVMLMSILIIYLFNPRYSQNIAIDSETKMLLFLFGIVLLITAKWNYFIKEAKWFTYLQQIIGK